MLARLRTGAGFRTFAQILLKVSGCASQFMSRHTVSSFVNFCINTLYRRFLFITPCLVASQKALSAKGRTTANCTFVRQRTQSEKTRGNERKKAHTQRQMFMSRESADLERLAEQVDLLVLSLLTLCSSVKSLSMPLFRDRCCGQIQATQQLLRDPQTDWTERSMLITKLAEAIEALGKEAGGYSDAVQLLLGLSVRLEWHSCADAFLRLCVHS